MNTFLKLQLLAIIQGLTEFLPVSSSGHLALFGKWLGLETPTDSAAMVEILLHAGTLFAVLAFYHKKIYQLIRGVITGQAQAWRYCIAVVLSCIPAGVLYLLAGDYMEALFDKPLAVAALLLVTGGTLLSLQYAEKRLSARAFTPKKIGFIQALLIGCAQALAILPGISRSGSTYTTARWLGIPADESFDFAFIMSIPVIGGAVLLKMRDFSALSTSGMLLPMIVAAAVSAIVGYGALKLLAIIRIAGRFQWFGYYCIAAGILAGVINILF